MVILIVEDDTAVLQALRIVLEQEGYTVVPAQNGEQALRAIEKTPPDLVILDLWMPVMNGWEFIGRLRDLHNPVREVPVIAVSADVRAAEQDLPVEIFMTKPMDMEKLLGAVRENLHQRT